MLLGMAQLFSKNGLSIPVMLTEQINDTSDYPDVVEFLQPVKLEGTLKNENETFVFEAKGNTEVNLRCDRCLAPVRKELCFEIKERFAHTGRGNEETETFSGDQIDLADFVRRGILCALPMKVLCSDHCKGLCPVCGKNLNEGVCECDTTYIDPRFESLRTLFNVDEEV
ncbi:YceD family protein [Anaerotignum propionicum]|jgi:uncharacterized protein|uniref:DUF177 domain-containing protein n=1 Tax=Anaerotignum propionicum DSM 1682 TaxID=991789 RepID=A0A0X8VDS2_ANAPI|nr:DUF177 domain-containing protein [Anaerotignum propionicum]AMJ41944.1 hypothetical protein CPRO_23770 [Anaerotignum propionicum DSM 1682]MEA5057812.1 DUF177 domain-containing protein [Anaerotignum propionicum]SHE94373.1 uncharacterized protein SAMN02745151_02280 [[Clostridium] propionicum DSM 1682] [Anaerotignum propionicum DSM 1682]